MRINDKENYENIRSKITMKNLKSIIENNGFSVVKVAMNSKISDSTVNAYINGQKNTKCSYFNKYGGLFKL